MADLFGETDVSWGLASEVGLIAQSYSGEQQSEQAMIRDHEGKTVAISVYDPHFEHTIEGYITTGGLADAVVGATPTIANAISATGILITTSVSFSKENEDFNQMTVTAVQYPEVTAANPPPQQ